ncbi:hypothetical protein JQ608_06755 [Bradyrhizobium liaoningense]|uniref:hypothetical protein n=1 Tax=Bradyrhizobium liaoningense TaxID=43992 RepID=UPI001BA79A20|nr:hypothetical protein [Bradyrhizobium liaoningense]MBR0876901.1 hypothetical protein [Bradyrhizobium liaoningense]
MARLLHIVGACALLLAPHHAAATDYVRNAVYAPDARCETAARYDAMREGRACAHPIQIAGFSMEWPDDERSITCRMVRWAMKRYDAATLESMARARGVSEATIERLRKCL